MMNGTKNHEISTHIGFCQAPVHVIQVRTKRCIMVRDANYEKQYKFAFEDLCSKLSESNKIP